MITPQRIGIATALLYASLAFYNIVIERQHPNFLSGLGAFLVTLPMSIPFSAIDFHPGKSHLAIAGAAVAANAWLVYRAAWRLARVFMPGQA